MERSHSEEIDSNEICSVTPAIRNMFNSRRLSASTADLPYGNQPGSPQHKDPTAMEVVRGREG